MAATIKYGDTKWAVKDGNTLGYNDENRFKPVPFDFTRNSIGTRVDRNGLIETIGNNIPRIDFTDNTDGHLLLEPQSTNLITYSEDFSEWSLSNATVEGGYLAPDGSNNAYKVSGTVGSSSIYLGGVNATDTRTIWARTVSGTGQAQLCSYFGNTNNLKKLTNEWQRFEVVDTTTATGAANFYAIDFRGSTDLSEIIIWGAQSEALSHSTSYIPTNGSTVTRASETCTNAGNSTLINSTEGVLYAEIAALANDGTNRRISISDGSDTNRLNLFYTSTTNEIKANYRVSNSTVVTIDTTDFDITSFNKIAFRWQSGNFVLFINGQDKGTNSNTTMISANTLNVLRFEDPNLVNEFYGKCKALTVYNTALTDAELTELTS